MRLLPEHTYTEKSSGQQFTTSPTGSLDLHQVIKSRPYWEKINPSSGEKKKALLLCDWRVAHWSRDEYKEKRYALKARLAECLSEKNGFSVYIWQGPKVKPIKLTLETLNILDDSYITKNIKPAFDDELTQAMAAHKIGAKKFLALDDYYVDRLLATEEIPTERVISIEAIKNVHSDDLDKLIEVTHQKKPKVSHIEHTVFSSKNNQTLLKIQKTFPHLKTVYDYKEVNFTKNDNIILNNQTIELANLSLRVDKKLLGKVEELNIYYSEFTESAIKKLMNNMPNLKSVVMEGCSLKNSKGKGINPLHKLEKLHLSSSAFSANFLETVSGAANNLKKLDIDSCTILGTIKRKLIHPKLISLNLNRSDIDSPSVKCLVENATQLKKLILIKCTLLGAFSKKIALPQIYELYLSYTKIDAHIFHELLSATKNLKILCAERTTIYGELLEFVKLPSLITLKLMQSNINWESTKNLISDSKKLKFMLTPSGHGLPWSHVEIMDYCKQLNKENKFQIRKTTSTEPSPLSQNPFNFPESESLPFKPASIPAKGPAANPRPHRENTTAHIDANTKNDPNAHFPVKQIFFPLDEKTPTPHVSTYRLQVFNNVTISQKKCDIQNAFKVHNSEKINLEKRTDLKSCPTDVYTLRDALKRDPSASYFYGKQEFILDNEWQAIASLSPNETLTHYHVDPNAKIDIQYSKRDNLYYIKSTGDPGQVTLDFIVKNPKTTQLPSAKIQKDINRYKNFGEGALELKKKTLTGEEYLAEIEKGKGKGACRHRAIAFKAAMDKEGIPSRIILNGCHAFVEVKENNTWIICDLSGYDAELSLDKSNDPRDTAFKAPAETQRSKKDKKKSRDPDWAPQFDPAKNPSSPSAPSSADFEHLFETWRTAEEKTKSPEQFMQNLLQAHGERHLIKLPTKQAIAAFAYHLQKMALEDKRPIFYIHSPDDLVCSAPYIKRTGNIGKPQKGPGGDLHDFLLAHQDSNNPAVLIVNYDTFDAEDIVRLNTLLDDNKRKADGTDVPPKAVVVGLINPNKPDCYQGSDYYSRFDDRVTLSEKKTAPLEKSLPPPPITTDNNAKANKHTECINLFHSSNWKERLFGHWTPKGKKLIYEKGPLTIALEKGQQIIIQNAPKNDPDYALFWRQVSLYQYVNVEGKMPTSLHPHKSKKDETITLPADFNIIEQTGYDWKSLRQVITGKKAENTEILNTSLLNQFFQQYHCDNQEKSIAFKSGIIEQYKNQSLHLYVTAELNQDAWAMLLTECQNKVSLSLTCAPGVTLPAELAKVPHQTELLQKSAISHTHIIHTNDRDVSVARLKKNHPKAIVIDVSECTPSDLLRYVDAKFDKDTLEFSFEEKQRALLNALEKKQHVILTGHFSAELIDHLAPLLYHRSKSKDAKGRLSLVTESKTAFSFFPVQQEVITTKDKKAILTTAFDQKSDKKALESLDQKAWEKYGLAELRAQLRHARIHPDAKPFEAWNGLNTLPPQKFKTQTINIQNIAKTAEEKATEFVERRIKQVDDALTHAPFVFLAGATGVGKTTFVDKYWREHTDSLHMGIKHVREWATDETEGIKTLFIDEANMSDRQWSEFEGLFHDPRGILIDGHYYPLKKNHKVIFAGNPASYGGEREIPSLFARHANVVVFEPLSLEYVYHNILKPVFDKTKLQNQCNDIIELLLKVYQFLCDCSKEEVLITPRELCSMALLTLSYCDRHSEAEPSDIARFYAYHVAKNLVPADKKSEFDRLLNKDKLPTPASDQPITSEDFILTSSRQTLYQQINSFLALRNYRRTTATNDAQKYGGLGGIVIEGEPGIGKSELVLKTLKEAGFQEANSKANNSPNKRFHIMPASMKIKDKEALLLKAFDQGDIVFADEFSSSPMMEDFLNALLMGKTPDGKLPTKPGFMIIGTQNPITMAGRRAASTALSRRFLQCQLSPYTTEERRDILTKKKLPPEIAAPLTKAYETKRQEAKEKHLSPGPNFRDLLKQALRIVRDGVTAVLRRKNLNKRTQNKADETNQWSDTPDHHTKNIFETNKKNTIDNSKIIINNNPTTKIQSVSSLNNLSHGLITAIYSPSDDSVKISFLNNNIRDIILESLKNNTHYDASFLKKGKRLIIPFKTFILKEKNTGTSLHNVLKDNIQMIMRYLPYDIRPCENNTFSSNQPLPHTLIEKFSLKRLPSASGSFLYRCKTSFTDIASALFQDAFTLIDKIIQELSSHTTIKDALLLKLAKAHNVNILTKWKNIIDHCEKQIEITKADAENFFSFFNSSKIDKTTELLHQSIKHFKDNLEFNFTAEGRIQNRQQLINTHEKHKLVKNCIEERTRGNGQPYNKIQKNSALLLLEHHLISSHPYYTAADVWAHIKNVPVKNHGTGKNYRHESENRDLRLEEILQHAPSIKTFVRSLSTSKDAATNARETLGT